MFQDNVKDIRASSIIYSLVETVKLNDPNIYAYLETILLYMPDHRNETEELMPWSDMIQQKIPDQIEKLKLEHFTLTT